MPAILRNADTASPTTTNSSSAALTEETKSFFVAGGTLPKNTACYVSRRADSDLLNAVRANEYVYVLTARQMGKSSLMVRTTQTLRDAGDAVAVLDLTAIGQNLTPEQWYEGMLNLVGQQTGLEDALDDYWLDHDRTPPMRRFFDAIRDVVLPRKTQENRRVVLFVDEVDSVQSLPFSADEFFAGVRACWNERTDNPAMRRLVWGLFGVAAPGDLIRDTRMTPFNIGRRIELTDFSLDEMKPLADALSDGAERNNHKLLERAYYWTHGHPYLTLRVCKTIAGRNDVKTAPDVDLIVASLFFGDRARETDDNLLFVRERVLRGAGQDIAAVLSLYRTIRAGKEPVAYDETDPQVSLLLLSGLVRAENGRLVARNRIYDRAFGEEWIESNLPESELRRVRETYKRSLQRTFFWAGGVGAVLCGLLVFAVGQMIRAKQETFKVQTLIRATDISEVRDILPKTSQVNFGADTLLSKTLVPRLNASGVTLLRTITAPGGAVSPTLPAVLSPDGKTLALSQSDGVVLRDAQTGAVQHKFFQANGFQNRAFSANGNCFVATAFVGSHSGLTQVWDVRTGERIGKFQLDPPYSSQIGVSADGGRVFVHSAKTWSIWDTRSGRRLLEAANSGFGVSHDGKTVYVSDANGAAKVYRLP